MPEDQMQKIYTVILDVQKQLGQVSRETGEQTTKLISIEAQTIKTNGRVTILESTTEKLQLVNTFNDGKVSVRTSIFSIIVGILVTVLTAIIINKVHI